MVKTNTGISLLVRKGALLLSVFLLGLGNVPAYGMLSRSYAAAKLAVATIWAGVRQAGNLVATQVPAVAKTPILTCIFPQTAPAGSQCVTRESIALLRASRMACSPKEFDQAVLPQANEIALQELRSVFAKHKIMDVHSMPRVWSPELDVKIARVLPCMSKKEEKELHQAIAYRFEQKGWIAPRLLSASEAGQLRSANTAQEQLKEDMVHAVSSCLVCEAQEQHEKMQKEDKSVVTEPSMTVPTYEQLLDAQVSAARARDVQKKEKDTVLPEPKKEDTQPSDAQVVSRTEKKVFMFAQAIKSVRPTSVLEALHNQGIGSMNTVSAVPGILRCDRDTERLAGGLEDSESDISVGRLKRAKKAHHAEESSAEEGSGIDGGYVADYEVDSDGDDIDVADLESQKGSWQYYFKNGVFRELTEKRIMVAAETQTVFAARDAATQTVNHSATQIAHDAETQTELQNQEPRARIQAHPGRTWRVYLCAGLAAALPACWLGCNYMVYLSDYNRCMAKCGKPDCWLTDDPEGSVSCYHPA